MYSGLISLGVYSASQSPLKSESWDPVPSKGKGAALATSSIVSWWVVLCVSRLPLKAGPGQLGKERTMPWVSCFERKKIIKNKSSYQHVPTLGEEGTAACQVLNRLHRKGNHHLEYNHSYLKLVVLTEY